MPLDESDFRPDPPKRETGSGGSIDSLLIGVTALMPRAMSLSVGLFIDTVRYLRGH